MSFPSITSCPGLKLAGYIKDLPRSALFVDADQSCGFPWWGCPTKQPRTMAGQTFALPKRTPTTHMVKIDSEGLRGALGCSIFCLEIARSMGRHDQVPCQAVKTSSRSKTPTCPNPAYVAAIGVPVMCFRDRIMYRMEQSAEARGRYPLMETLGRGCAHVWRSNSSRMLLITRIGRCGSLEAQQGRRQQCRPQIGPTRAHR
jgi:hypothetical protein